MLTFRYKPEKNDERLPVLSDGQFPVLTFPALDACGCVKHGFTTREGGVSTGIFRSLNFSSNRGDEPAAVRENFRRVAAYFGVTEDAFVFTDQTHTANVRRVTRADAGKGLTRPQDYTDVDGLITNEPGLVLTAFVADCVPVAIVDPVRRAIGLVHSGWRGTAGRISRVAVSQMQEAYGTDPSDLVCAVGPSICRDCYEVSADVADVFAAEFAAHTGEILTAKGGGKYQLDLHRTNRIILEEAGVRPENISVTGLCTCCNPDLLFSHRATGGKRGNLGAFLMLTPDTDRSSS